jgi:predicted transcriptional regulator
MAMLICEGFKVRVNDPWSSESNGKEFYVDLNTFKGEIPHLPEEVNEEDLNRFQLIFKLNDGLDYSGKIKDSIIEAALRLLDLQKQQGTKPKGRTFELISEMTGISSSYVRQYCESKSSRTKKKNLTDEERKAADATKELRKLRGHMRYLVENLGSYDWPKTVSGLGIERQLAEEVIEKLQETIIEGDEEMKKITVEYQLEDSQCEYLGRIYQHYPEVSEADLFMMIMIEGSALDINRRMQDFCKERNIENDYFYRA